MKRKEIKRDILATLRASSSIDTSWSAYERHVLPHDAGSIQIGETKRAYFCGASWLFQTFMRKLSAEGSDGANRWLLEIDQELDSYRKSTAKRGGA